MATSITTRAGKGSALTHNEVDANFTNLQTTADAALPTSGGVISANSASDALRITQTGSGKALVVEDSANPDSTPFVVTAAGDVGIGTGSPAANLHVAGYIIAAFGGNVGLTLRQATTANRFQLFVGDGTGGYVADDNYIVSQNTDLHFLAGASGTTEVMRLALAGNLTMTASGGTMGYGTGSGGAQTQGTSRTTGVTLNASNGAITLVSAAGSTTWQTFTVTNSTVAATDVVYVCQKSGTDLYEIHVTNVAAGSFKISYRTTGGTTTEQPVFNFAVIKAVTS